MVDSNYDGKFTVVGGTAPTVTMQEVAPNAIGEYEVRGTFVATATSHTVRMGNGYSAGEVWYDDIAAVAVPAGETYYKGDFFSGDTPDATGIVYDWTGTPNNSDSVAYGSYPGSVIGTTPHLDTEPQGYTIENLRPGTRYDVQVRAISVFGVPGLLSSVLSFDTPAAADILTAPTEPLLESALGGVVATWDGYLETGIPPVGFKYVYGEWSYDAEAGPYTPFGTALTGPGSLNLSGLPHGYTVAVRLRAVDNLGRISEPSNAVTVEVRGVTGPDIEANTITANNIEAFSITANELHPSVGDTLDISANGTINIIAGVAQDAQDVANGAASSLEDLQTVYSFTPTEAIISSPDSNYQLALDSNGIEIREGPGAAPVSWWDAAGMHVTLFEGTKVIIGNHQLEKYGTGSVVRRIANL